MLKDIPQPTVTDVAIAIVKEVNKENAIVWNVYLVNFKPQEITGVLVSSNGYGVINKEEVKTSSLRHFLDTVLGRSFALVEPIMENIFGITNQFWVSFYLEGQIYDKKYIFLPETIREENFISIPILNLNGVMIK
jgi:hypothetical protein